MTPPHPIEPTSAPLAHATNPRGSYRSTLDTKLVRELRESASASVAISIVIAAGVAIFVMALSTLTFLNDTRDAYYDRNRLADVFATVTRAPLHVREQIALIDGVSRIETRVVAEITIQVPGLDEPASGRMISLPGEHPGDRLRDAGLNVIHLVKGRMPDWDSADEVVASEAFFISNRLTLGSTIRGILNGRFQEMRIVGVALSPEYVFQIRSGDFLPDDRRFGIFWTSRQHLEAAFDMKGAFNDVSLRLMHGVATRPVMKQLDQILTPYGGVGSYDRTEQLSARFLDDEIKQLRATGLIVPVIFLSVAAFLLNVVLARRIELQRASIATLIAFGYGGTEIAWHFLKYSLLISIAGSVLGSALGTWLAQGLCELYSDFFRFPTFSFQPNPRMIIIGSLTSVASGTIGAWAAVLRVMRLQPADAMRPPSPAMYHHGMIDRFWVMIGLPPSVVMIIRRLRRRPATTAMSMIGIGFAVAVLLVSNFAVDAIDVMIDFQFSIAQRQDIQLSFQHASAPSSEHELRNIDGVITAEPFRAIAVRISNGQFHRRTSILGLDGQRRLYRLLNSNGVPIRLPPHGIVLSDKLADLLNVSAGASVWVEVLEDRRQQVEVKVAGIATEYAGTNAYMDRESLHRLLQEDHRISGAFLSIDQSQRRSIYDTLQQMPRTAAVSIQAASLQAIRQTIKENQAKMQFFNVAFASVIALGVVYNMARVTMAEQQRELATLRVIGFTQLEVSMMFLGEMILVTIVAIPLGWMIGIGLCYWTVKGFESELYRIPLVISRQNLVVSGFVTFIASLVSGLIVRRSLDKINLVEVLKNHG